jgi:hypothetical protein
MMGQGGRPSQDAQASRPASALAVLPRSRLPSSKPKPSAISQLPVEASACFR